MKFLYRHSRRGLYAWPNVYYIGDIQGTIEEQIPEGKRIASDLVTSDIPIDDFDDGVYEINVYDTDARLYLWDHPEGYEKISPLEYMVPGEIPLDATHRELYAEDPFRTRIVSMENDELYESLFNEGFRLMDYLKAVHVRYGMIVDVDDANSVEEAEELYEARGKL